MSPKLSTTFALLLASSSLTFAQTSAVTAWFAPPNVAASIVGKNGDATTYALACTSACSSVQNGQGTMVNGPSTAAFTQVWSEDGAAASKTLIYDCQVKSANGQGECTVKAGQDGKTGTISRTTSFKADADVTVTAGWEKIGIVIATTTEDVSTTLTHKITSTSAPTPTPTPLITSAQNSTSSLSGYSNSTSSDSYNSPTRSTTRLPTSTGAAAAATSSPGAATGLSVQRVGGVIAGFAGLMMVML